MMIQDRILCEELENRARNLQARVTERRLTVPTAQLNCDGFPSLPRHPNLSVLIPKLRLSFTWISL